MSYGLAFVNNFKILASLKKLSSEKFARIIGDCPDNHMSSKIYLIWSKLQQN